MEISTEDILPFCDDILMCTSVKPNIRTGTNQKDAYDIHFNYLGVDKKVLKARIQIGAFDERIQILQSPGINYRVSQSNMQSVFSKEEALYLRLSKICLALQNIYAQSHEYRLPLLLGSTKFGNPQNYLWNPENYELFSHDKELRKLKPNFMQIYHLFKKLPNSEKSTSYAENPILVFGQEGLNISRLLKECGFVSKVEINGVYRNISLKFAFEGTAFRKKAYKMVYDELIKLGLHAWLDQN
jgi:hypothetical protein